MNGDDLDHDDDDGYDLPPASETQSRSMPTVCARKKSEQIENGPKRYGKQRLPRAAIYIRYNDLNLLLLGYTNNHDDHAGKS